MGRQARNYTKVCRIALLYQATVFYPIYWMQRVFNMQTLE